MALHGKIEVNDQTIGHWSARRREPAINRPGVPNTYECHVIRYGPAATDSRTFVVEHVYDDGALTLASKVLATAAQLINPATHLANTKCPLFACDRTTSCRPPAPTCPHPANRSRR